jgi:hypothetical protein
MERKARKTWTRSMESVVEDFKLQQRGEKDAFEEDTKDKEMWRQSESEFEQYKLCSPRERRGMVGEVLISSTPTFDIFCTRHGDSPADGGWCVHFDVRPTNGARDHFGTGWHVTYHAAGDDLHVQSSPRGRHPVQFGSFNRQWVDTTGCDKRCRVCRARRQVSEIMLAFCEKTW